MFYLQAEAKDTKTASITSNKGQFLPMVVIGKGILQKPWTPVWLAAREHAGLSCRSGFPMSWTYDACAPGWYWLWLRTSDVW